MSATHRPSPSGARAAWRGRLIAWLAGPSCETWSAARFNRLRGVKRQPRPVCSARALRGLKTGTIKEWLQLQIGNLLLRFTLLLAQISTKAAATGAGEHPDLPT